MNKTLQVILAFLCPLFALSNGFVIKGNVEGLQHGTVALAYVNEDGEDTTVKTDISLGAFNFTGNTAEPCLARLLISTGWPYSTNFFLENSAIDINIVKDAPQKTTITGSASNIIYEKLKQGLNTFFEHARNSEAAQHQYVKGSHPLQSADSLWATQQGKWIQDIRASITSNPQNYAALYFIKWLLFKPDNLNSVLAAFKQLSPQVQEGIAGKKFMAEFEHLNRTQPGQPAPEISGKDTSGQSVTLAALKGQVILLDFWASYCGPCRQENHRMLPMYQKYHPQGFEIVSLSLDNERRIWTEAIQADALPWPQVSELRGGAGATGGIYDITDLPRNVLIDKTGKIYAKDLHGDDLIKTVERLLGK